MISYSPKTDKDGKFLGMVLDNGGAWIPLSQLEAIQAKCTKVFLVAVWGFDSDNLLYQFAYHSKSEAEQKVKELEKTWDSVSLSSLLIE